MFLDSYLAELSKYFRMKAKSTMTSQDNPKLPLGWESKACTLTNVKTRVAPIKTGRYLVSLFPFPASSLLFVGLSTHSLSKGSWNVSSGWSRQLLGTDFRVPSLCQTWYLLVCQEIPACHCWCFLNSLYLNVVCFFKMCLYSTSKRNVVFIPTPIYT